MKDKLIPHLQYREEDDLFIGDKQDVSYDN